MHDRFMKYASYSHETDIKRNHSSRAVFTQHWQMNTGAVIGLAGTGCQHIWQCLVHVCGVHVLLAFNLELPPAVE